MEYADTSMHPNTDTSKDVARKSAAALLSGILLFCSFPPLEWSFCAWAALCPLILLSFSSSPGEAFRYGLAAGLVFWLASIFWLTRVSFIGWILVSLYCALYFAVFAFIVSWWGVFMHRNFPPEADPSSVDKQTPRIALIKSNEIFLTSVKSVLSVVSFRRTALILLFGIPAIWVGLEYARSNFLTGFPWNPLGVSQYANNSLIQCAEWGGVYLVSYIIMLGNAALALAICNRGAGILQAGKSIGLFLLIAALAVGCGKWSQARAITGNEKIKIAAVQPNVLQEYKWSAETVNDICRRLKTATAQALRSGPLDLIVWPETALPDFVRYSVPSTKLISESLLGGVPLLVGSMDYAESPRKTDYFNSAFLFIPGQDDPQVYAKRHLVLFGEYVPLGKYLPFLRAITEIEDDFTPGTENVVFQLATCPEQSRRAARQKFSALICFEDTLPYLARDCVRAGARLLVNQTNDAWFDPLWACRQHMAHCVFRCVENRVACLRAANTGLTCLIDARGVIGPALAPLGRENREPEVLITSVAFSPADMPLTFYTRHGDIFAIACAAFVLPIFLGALVGNTRKK